MVDTAPDIPEVDTAPDIPEVDTAPDIPEVDTAPDISEVDTAPDIPEVDTAPDIPKVEVTEDTTPEAEVPETTSTLAWDPESATDGAIELSNGNLTVSGYHPTCTVIGVTAPRALSSGRWYFEHTATRDGGQNDKYCPVAIGIQSSDAQHRVSWYGHHGTTTLSTGAFSCVGELPIHIDTGDVIGVAFDLEAGRIDYTKNGVAAFYCTVPVGTYLPWASHCNDSRHHCSGTTNFGATPFAFGPPTGYTLIP